MKRESGTMDQLATIRAAQRAKYERAQKEKQDAEDAARLRAQKEADAKANAEKLCKLLEKATQMRNPVYARIFCIQRWMRKYRGRVDRKSYVWMDGNSYGFAEAMQMQSEGIAPFGGQDGERAIDSHIIQTQRFEIVVAESKDYGASQMPRILWYMWVNTCRLVIEDGHIIPCLEHGLLDLLPVTDFSELLRCPYLGRDDVLENQFARWFRMYIAAQNGVPEWIALDSEVVMADAYEQMVGLLEKLRHRQLSRMEEEAVPSPDDELQCNGCQSRGLYGNMYRKEGAKCSFCRYCAVQIGLPVPPAEFNSPPVSPPNSPLVESDDEDV